MEQSQNSKDLGRLYDKYHKLVLIIPALLLIISLVYLFSFYSQHNDILLKDVTLSGGSSITIYDKISPEKIQQDLSDKLEDLEVIQLYDIITREQIGVILSTKTTVDDARPILEDYLGYKLNDQNASFEYTGASLSTDFYDQLRKAVLVGFLLMSLVVFLVFGEQFSLKIYAIILTLFAVDILFINLSSVHSLITFILLPISIISLIFIKSKLKYKWIVFFIFLLMYVVQFFISISILLIPLSIALIAMYVLFSVPSLAVIISAFADMVMTLAVVDFMGIKMSSAGLVAFLMLIGYSVDTDIMLTNRLIKSTPGKSVNQNLWSAFKTGMTMTMTALFAVLVSLIITRSLSPVLSQIFTVILIGLIFDILNTWLTNTSLLKWYIESKGRKK